MSALTDLVKVLQQQDALEYQKEKDESALDMSFLQMQMQRDQSVEDRNIAIQEAEKNREFERSQLFIKSNLDNLQRLNQQKFTLSNKSSELGLTSKEINKNPDKSSGAVDIVNTNGENLNNEITEISGDINSIQDNISNYYSGINLAKNLDQDLSGVVEDYELKDLADEFSNNPAFMHGIRNYTLGVDQRTQLIASRAQVEGLKLENIKKQIELDFLPKSLKQDYDQGKININMGNLQIEDLIEARETTRIKNEQLEENLTLTRLEILKNQEAFDQLNYEQDKQLRTDHIASIEKMSVENITTQSEIGVEIFSNIFLELDKGTVTPFFSILAGSEDPNVDYIDEINNVDKLNLINQDLISLYTAYGLGKSEEMVPDYSMVLNQIEDIVRLKDVRQNFINQYEGELASTARRLNRNKYSAEVLEQVAMTKDPDLYSVDDILKAGQWGQTGIYDNMEILNSAIKSDLQRKQLKSMLEKAKGFDLTYTQNENQGFGNSEMNFNLINEANYTTPSDAPADSSDILDAFKLINK